MTVTVLSCLRDQARDHPSDPAFAVRAGEDWVTSSWAEHYDLVRRAARALISFGVGPGGTVGILANNRPEWTITCLGAMATGGAPAGIYQTSAPDQVGYVLEHAESRVAVVENAAQLAKIARVRDRLTHLVCVVVMTGHPDQADADGLDGVEILSWAEFLARAEGVPEAELDRRLEALRSDQLATLIYTSGTTGFPKGVMLSHGNLIETGRVSRELHGAWDADRLFSYLPLSHIAEQMLSVHMSVQSGSVVYYSDAPEKLADDLRHVEPTVFFGVPRVWERIHAVLTEKLAAAPPIRRALAHWALEVGGRIVARRDRGATVGGWLALQGRWADKLVLSKIRQRLGLSKVRACASGAAPIRRDILDFFDALGLRIYEVYGLSECCGPGTWNHFGLTRLGTVGPPLPEVDLKIADDGEVLLRGPNVFMGYYKNPEATAETLVDGWLHTGDLGTVDDDGCLTIIGRKKEILITSGGKNIAPAAIEAKLKQIDLVGEAMLVGEARHFLTALLTLEPEATARFAAEHGIAGPPTEDPRVLAAIERGVEAVNQTLARVEHVRKFHLLPRPWSVEAGELTPTLKLKRDVVEKRYAAEIEALYTR